MIWVQITVCEVFAAFVEKQNCRQSGETRPGKTHRRRGKGLGLWV